MKKCSIVYVGLKSGFQFLKGDFNTQENLEYTSELRSLTEDFKKTFNPTIEDMGQTVKNFLNENGWDIIYNDYSTALNEGMSKSEADDFISKLKKAEVKFKFKKVKDNSTRTARGTLNKAVIRHEIGDVEKAKRKHTVPDNIIVYWDLDKKDFRSFRKSNFIKIIKYKFYKKTSRMKNEL